jgi:uncharacterized protein YegP (UPF0339 family)
MTMAGRFVLKRSGAQFYFVLQASGNHETLITSERYVSKQGAENGIDSVKTNAPHDQRYEHKVASNGTPYFVLKAANGEPIGTSEMYSSNAARDHGIEATKNNAPTATTADET